MTATWADKLAALRSLLGREPTLDEMIALSRRHKMLPEEIEAQRQSWVRANKATGDARFD